MLSNPLRYLLPLCECPALCKRSGELAVILHIHTVPARRRNDELIQPVRPPADFRHGMDNRDIRIGRLKCLEIFNEELCRFTGGVKPAIRERDDIARGKCLRPFADGVHPVIVIPE